MQRSISFAGYRCGTRRSDGRLKVVATVGAVLMMAVVGATPAFAGTGGSLSPAPGSPTATGSFPESVAFSPSGNLLAVANYGDSTVSLFTVGAGGSLSAATGSPTYTVAPISVAFKAPAAP